MDARGGWGGVVVYCSLIAQRGAYEELPWWAWEEVPGVVGVVSSMGGFGKVCDVCHAWCDM